MKRSRVAAMSAARRQSDPPSGSWVGTGHFRAASYCEIKLFESDGAQGRNRTTDTAIFSRMLYQLSYLGAGAGIAVAIQRTVLVRRPARFLAREGV